MQTDLLEIDDLFAVDSPANDLELFELLAETGDGPPAEAAERAGDQDGRVEQHGIHRPQDVARHKRAGQSASPPR